MNSKPALENILKLCDRLCDAHQQNLPHSDLTDQEQANLAEAGSLLKEDLPPSALLLMSLFFHRRVQGNYDTWRGGEIISLLYRAGIPRTESLTLLFPSSALRQGSWLRGSVEPSQHDPLDAWFDVTPKALQWLQGIPVESTGLPAHAPKPYLNEEDLLWDLYAWRQLCIRRAETLFDEGAHPSVLQEARQQARRKLFSIRARIQSTENGRALGIEKFRRNHKLGQDHLLIILHLLFSELLEAEPFLSGLECLRLISETRNDLFRKRQLFSRQGLLRRSKIVHADSRLGKELAATLSLADWAAGQVLLGVRGLPRIQDTDLGGHIEDEA
ncbi:MAG: hypothetical protein OTJ44_03010 [Planctomycetota bacterium]|nr:hypothetical protein [Planctomycetota bacterium]